MNLRRVVSVAALGLFPVAWGSAQPAPTASADARLVLRGLDGQERVIGPADLARFPRRDTTVSAHHVQGRYSGVLLSDILSLVNAPTGDSLRGRALATYVRIEAADGYRVILTLAEFDAGYTDRIALLADRKDGASLPAAEGPFHLIIPGDKRPARWVRQVTRIEVRAAQ
jgi:hypothetical protein